MILLGVSIYLVINFFLTFIGIEKQNEGLKIFIISMLLTPLAGLLFMASRKKNYVKVKYYYKECDCIIIMFPNFLIQLWNKTTLTKRKAIFIMNATPN